METEKWKCQTVSLYGTQAKKLKKLGNETVSLFHQITKSRPNSLNQPTISTQKNGRFQFYARKQTLPYNSEKLTDYY